MIAMDVLAHAAAGHGRNFVLVQRVCVYWEGDRSLNAVTMPVPVHLGRGRLPQRAPCAVCPKLAVLPASTVVTWLLLQTVVAVKICATDHPGCLMPPLLSAVE